MEAVWVFNGGGEFPSAVFSTRAHAEQWICQHQLSGTLTWYPLDVGVYEWAMERGFTPKRPDQREPSFIARFSSASLEHYHYEDGGEAGSVG